MTQAFTLLQGWVVIEGSDSDCEGVGGVVKLKRNETQPRHRIQSRVWPLFESTFERLVYQEQRDQASKAQIA